MTTSNEQGVCGLTNYRTSPARTKSLYGQVKRPSDVVSLTPNLGVPYRSVECNVFDYTVPPTVSVGSGASAAYLQGLNSLINSAGSDGWEMDLAGSGTWTVVVTARATTNQVNGNPQEGGGYTANVSGVTNGTYTNLTDKLFIRTAFNGSTEIYDITTQEYGVYRGTRSQAVQIDAGTLSPTGIVLFGGGSAGAQAFTLPGFTSVWTPTQYIEVVSLTRTT